MDNPYTPPSANPPSPSRSMKAIFTIIEKPGDRAFWLRIGWAFLNRDGSYSLNLDALPVNGKLQMRDWQPRDDDPTRASREQREPREDREPRLAAV